MAPDSQTAHLDLPASKILVAQDSGMNRIVTQRVLEKLGQEVTQAADQTSLLGLLETERFDTILIEGSFGGRPRHEWVDHLRDIESARTGGPIRRAYVVGLFSTECADVPDDMLHTLDLDDILRKPVDPIQVRSLLERRLEAPGASVPSTPNENRAAGDA